MCKKIARGQRGKRRVNKRERGRVGGDGKG